MNSIAVVLLNYNGLELLKQFLPKAIMFSKQASVVLVDNASNDNSTDWVKTNYPEIKCI